VIHAATSRAPNPGARGTASAAVLAALMEAPKGPTEHAHQAAAVRRLRALEALVPALAHLAAIPNGGKRTIAAAGQIRGEGGRGGLPDLVLPFPVRAFHGAWVEVKRPASPGYGPGRLEPEQREWLGQLTNNGYFTAVAWGCDAVCWAVGDYLGAPIARWLQLVPPKLVHSPGGWLEVRPA